MLLLFPCPGITPSRSQPTSLLSSSLRASCTCAATAPSHRSRPSTTAPTSSCAVDHAPSPCESGPETRSSPWRALRRARTQTPRLAVRDAAADHWARAPAVQPRPSGSRFKIPWCPRLHFQRRLVTVQEPFFRLEGGFLHALDRRRFLRLHRRGTRHDGGHRHGGSSPDLSSTPERPELGGEPCGGGVNRCDVHLQDVQAQVPSLAYSGRYVFMCTLVQSRYKSAVGTPE